jgi:SnoaL-like domain
MSSIARRFVDAFLRGDAPSATALLAPEATFHSPIRDYAGAERIAVVWEAVAGIVVDARTTSVHDHPARRSPSSSAPSGTCPSTGCCAR